MIEFDCYIKSLTLSKQEPYSYLTTPQSIASFHLNQTNYILLDY